MQPVPHNRALAFLLAALVVSWSGGPSPVRADELGESIAHLHRRLDAWDTAGAREGLARLVDRSAERSDLRSLEIRLALSERDFEEAWRLAEPLCRSGSPELPSELCTVSEGSARVTRDFKSVTTAAGHFVLHYLPGPDEVLIPYAEQSLEAAYERLGARFRYHPTEPVHVDILPRAEDLAAMTPLSREEIETSGTVAMCRYGRLMIISPRDLVYGYGWLDTLAHEYIHYLLTRRSGNRVPLWLHEGLAKFFDVTWRADAQPRLEPAVEDALAEALRRRKLIPLEKIHPSIAKLPSQEAASLAFAQVHTLVRYMMERHGEEGLARLLDALRDGASMDEALESVYGRRFAAMQRDWRKWLARQPLVRLPRAAPSRKLFRGRDRPEDELAAIAESRGRELTYLGDLLRARGRLEASLREYDKAAELVGETSPVLQSKRAAALVALGRHEAALDALEAVLVSYPGHVLLHLHQGEALLRLGRSREAAAALARAVGLNPFDHKVHRLLAESYEALGLVEEAAFERRQHALVVAE